MITEPQVVEAVCKYLKRCGFRVTQNLKASERGDDIVARSPDETIEVAIEAKGGTSSKSTTNRFGKPFDAGQVIVHVSRALYRAAACVSNKRHAGIALPFDQEHNKCVNRILPALARLGIEIFWVHPNMKVTHIGHWKSWPKWRNRKLALSAVRRKSINQTR